MPLLRLTSRTISNTPSADLVSRLLVGQHQRRFHRQRGRATVAVGPSLEIVDRVGNPSCHPIRKTATRKSPFHSVDCRT